MDATEFFLRLLTVLAIFYVGIRLDVLTDKIMAIASERSKVDKEIK